MAKGLLKLLGKQYLENHRKNKVSAGLSEFLWPSKEGKTRVEFRSPVPDFPPPGQLIVVPSDGGRMKPGGEYCLAACDDGTVRWLPELECLNESHVWTVQLFDVGAGVLAQMRNID
ncbi:hypothetical protein RND81_10G223800 [Saponaria officinalis]|uniref:Uncharacterized protein n=1 Tax=Saponaria officinalis TaxID=3572 RepID=A0AAW1I7K6_SAPOF